MILKNYTIFKERSGETIKIRFSQIKNSVLIHHVHIILVIKMTTVIFENRSEFS